MARFGGGKPRRSWGLHELDSPKCRIQNGLEEWAIDNDCQICLECGYSLRGLPAEHHCPECGVAYRLSNIEARWNVYLAAKNGSPLR